MIATKNEDKARLVLIVILLIAAFTAITAFVEGIPLADVPEVVKPHWSLLTSFFASGLGAFLVALGYNVYGYATAYYRSECKEVYDPNKLYKTLVQFAGYFTTIDTTLAMIQLNFGDHPAIWIIATGAKIVFVVVVALISELKRLKT